MTKSFDHWLISWPVQDRVQEYRWIKGANNGDIWQLTSRIQQISKEAAYNPTPLVVTAPCPPTVANLIAQGNHLVDTGEIDKAEQYYRKALVLEPSNAEAHFKLGNILLKTNCLAAAEACYLNAIKYAPDFVKAHYNLGNTFKYQGKLSEAERSYRTALKIDPSYTSADNNLGALLADAGRFEEAEACYRRVLTLVATDALALTNLSIALKGQGLLADAERYCRLAIEFNPDYAAAYNSLGSVLRQQGQVSEAEDAYRNALAISADYAEALHNLSVLLKAQQRIDEAEDLCRKALFINPNYSNAHVTLCNVLMEQSRFDQAEEASRQSLVLNPSSAESYNCLAGALISQGKTSEAITAFEKALELKPDYSQAHSNLLFALNYRPELTSSKRFHIAQSFGQSISNKVDARFNSWSCPLNPQRLRVGIVSGDLRNHAVGFFLEGFLSQIDPARIELIAYPTRRTTDKTTLRLRGFMSEWKPISEIGDRAAAQLIHDDAIHVLLDLSGHTSNNRLPIFAWKPAPVQATWLGYFATTGVAEIDYIIADKTGVPEGNRDQFSESVYYLPDTRLCFTPPVMNIQPSETPARTNGYVTFGCFQNISKLNDNVLQIWGKILALNPRARLYIQSIQLESLAAKIELIDRLRHYSIAAERVTLQGPLERDSYLAAYAKVDVILDTFPYPGGTTTCEALWMGVPTVTLAGHTMLEKQGASLLTAAGRAEWVANSEDDYVDKAIALSSDIPSIEKLRRGLRKQTLESPLFDAPRFARNLENALWDMWSRYRTTGP